MVSMFRVVVLGSGGSIPTSERGLPAIAVKAEGNVMLFDCGEGTQRQMMKFNVSYGKISHIFLTHLHADHIMGIVGLTQTLEMNGRTDKLNIFGPVGTSDLLKTFLGAYRQTSYKIEIKEIKSEIKIDLGQFVVSSFPTKHGRSLGYTLEEKEKLNFDEKKAKKLGIKGIMFSEIETKGKLKLGTKTIKLSDVAKKRSGIKIVYTGDTLPCEATVNASKNADLLIHDGTFGEDLEEEADDRLHSTVADAARTAKLCKAKRLVLVHISNRYKDGNKLLAQAKKIFKDSTIAYDGLEIHL